MNGARISSTNVKGVNLRRLRKAQGMTQTVLAELIGTVQAEVSFWENGVHGISMEKARKVAEALGCKLTDIIKLEAENL
jgi:transcriptional regulator with XRE-family HTH domain